MTIYVRRVSLPDASKGFVAPDEDGNYNIYLNDRLDGDAFDDAFAHELVHAMRCDCMSAAGVDVLEESLQ